jgi:hypothetical protein|tara:strand:+ start:994 stop:3651 length:2658 start_codon:yes stop_codon:yes gene_type:complete
MPAITQRINNFLGGVSTQPDTKKLPGQVKEAKNVYPDPALGLTKRPGFKFLDALHDGSGTDYTTPAFANAKWFYINRDDDEVYLGCIVGNATPSNAAIHIWNATPDGSGNYIKSTVTYGSTGNPQAYLDALTSKDYELLTVQDTSILVNKTKTVAALAGTAPTTFSGSVLIRSIEYSATYSVIINGTTYSYQTYNADNFTNASNTDTKLNADTILTGLKSAIDGASISGLTVEKGSNCLELTRTSAFTLDAKGGVGGTALRSFQDEVDVVTDLPSVSKHGRQVTVVNTSASADTYYAEFVANSGSGLGDGYWMETLKPGLSPGLDAATMPHELINTSLNNFTFQQISYTERLVGDDNTNSQPSFVGGKINGAFFNNNRLGFLTGENVSMSQSGEFFNFYHVTSSVSTANDPVDLACSSVRPLQLHAALPSSLGMMLFSQNQQFIMYSESGNLTPQDSLINGMSNYEMDKNIPPVEVGTNIYFVSKTPAWSRIFSYTLRGLQNPPQVLDIGKVVSQYIPSSVTHMVSSPQNSFVCLYGETDKTLYFYRFYDTGERQEMQAWFKWTLPGFPLSINVEQDVMYAVIQAGNKYIMCSLNISSTPSEAIVTSSTGNAVNPYMDFYATAASVTSLNGGSRINLPFDDITGLDPVILVKGSGINFSNISESGFTAPVTKVTSGGSTYFYLPGKDLSSQASDVVVGYKFAYDVTLPTIYYQQTPEGSRVDYASYLTLNRLKFSCGETSNFGLKLRVQGIRGDQFTFTGDGSTTTFTLPFTPDDRNDVVVKINDVASTAFTINDAGSIVFSSAPSNGSSILAYEDYVFAEQNAADVDYYLADDVAIEGESIYTFPINQRNKNVEIRIFNNTPFPISLSSMVWEGQYSQRFIRRA